MPTNRSRRNRNTEIWKPKLNERVFVLSEGFDGDVVTIHADGTYRITMSVVNEDGDDYNVICTLDDLDKVEKY